MITKETTFDQLVSFGSLPTPCQNLSKMSLGVILRRFGGHLKLRCKSKKAFEGLECGLESQVGTKTPSKHLLKLSLGVILGRYGEHLKLRCENKKFLKALRAAWRAKF